MNINPVLLEIVDCVPKENPQLKMKAAFMASLLTKFMAHPDDQYILDDIKIVLGVDDVT